MQPPRAWSSLFLSLLLSSLPILRADWADWFPSTDVLSHALRVSGLSDAGVSDVLREREGLHRCFDELFGSVPHDGLQALPALQGVMNASRARVSLLRAPLQACVYEGTDCVLVMERLCRVSLPHVAFPRGSLGDLWQRGASALLMPPRARRRQLYAPATTAATPSSPSPWASTLSSLSQSTLLSGILDSVSRLLPSSSPPSTPLSASSLFGSSGARSSSSSESLLSRRRLDMFGNMAMVLPSSLTSSSSRSSSSAATMRAALDRVPSLTPEQRDLLLPVADRLKGEMRSFGMRIFSELPPSYQQKLMLLSMRASASGRPSSREAHDTVDLVDYLQRSKLLRGMASRLGWSAEQVRSLRRTAADDASPSAAIQDLASRLPTPLSAREREAVHALLEALPEAVRVLSACHAWVAEHGM